MTIGTELSGKNSGNIFIDPSSGTSDPDKICFPSPYFVNAKLYLH
jgi:hypothetical protein